MRFIIKLFVALILLVPVYFTTILLYEQDAFASPCFVQKSQAYTFHDVKSYPHDRLASTQGLIYDKGTLYESTGLGGGTGSTKSSLRRVELKTGKVTKCKLLNYFGEGLTKWQDRFIQLTLDDNVGFIYLEREKGFEQIKDFPYPTEGWGITHDGQHLIMSDSTEVLHLLDPYTFSEVGTIPVHDQGEPVKKLNELEYINGEIFANVSLCDAIARISPTTGQVLGWIDLSELRKMAELDRITTELNGIAYDEQGDRLFVTGKNWPKLFEIKLVPNEEVIE